MYFQPVDIQDSILQYKSTCRYIDIVRWHVSSICLVIVNNVPHSHICQFLPMRCSYPHLTTFTLCCKCSRSEKKKFSCCSPYLLCKWRGRSTTSQPYQTCISSHSRCSRVHKYPKARRNPSESLTNNTLYLKSDISSLGSHNLITATWSG